MTHRDIAWRSFGLASFIVACATGRFGGNGIGLLGFGLALMGVVLMVQGRRVPAALRVEFGRHRLLAQAIRARRRRSGGDPA